MKKLVILVETVGKKSLVTRFTDGVFLNSGKITIGADFHTKYVTVGSQRIKVQLWFIKGAWNTYASTLRKNYVRTMDSALVVYDITDRSTFEDVLLFLEEIREVNPAMPVTLIGNRCDLEDKRKVTTKEGEEFAALHGLNGFMETSAKTGANVEEAFMEAALMSFSPTGKSDPAYPILESFYNATNGSKWKNNTNWLSEKQLLLWYGVHIDAKTGKITGLELNDNQLRGQIPHSLSKLSTLRWLDLRNNLLTGNLDSVAAVRRIESSRNPGLKAPPPYVSQVGHKLEKWWQYGAVMIGLGLTVFDVVSDVLAAIAFSHIDTNLCAVQVCTVVFPTVYMATTTPRMLFEERLLHLTFLLPLVEGVRALGSGMESGLMREMRLMEALMESTPGSVLQLFFLLTYKTDSSQFRTIVMALVAGVASSTYTLLTLETVHDEGELQYGCKDPFVVRSVVYLAQVLGSVAKYAAIFASVGGAGFAVGWVSFSLRLASLGPSKFDEIVKEHEKEIALLVRYFKMGVYYFFRMPFEYIYVIAKRDKYGAHYDAIDTLSLALKTMAADSVAEPGYTQFGVDDSAYFRIRLLTMVETLLAAVAFFALEMSAESNLALVILVTTGVVQFSAQPMYHRVKRLLSEWFHEGDGESDGNLHQRGRREVPRYV